MGTERKLTERSRYTGDYDDTPAAAWAADAIGPCLLAPVSVPVGIHYTPTIDMRGYEKALFCILGGLAAGADGGLWVEVLQCTAPSPVLPATAPVIGAGAKSLAGSAGAKLLSDAVTCGGYYGSYSGYYFYNMNRKWLIEVDVEEMDVDNLYRYLQVRYEVTTREWLLAMEAERSLASYEACPQTFADQVIA